MTNVTCETCPNRNFCDPVFADFDRFGLSRKDIVRIIKDNRFPCAEKDRSKNGPVFWIVSELQKWWDENA